MKPHIAASLRKLEAQRERDRKREVENQRASLVPLGDSLADEMICFRLRALEKRRAKGARA